MFKKNKENEVIEMEQTTFIKRHANKILVAGGLVVAGGAYYLISKHHEELAEHALRIFNLEEEVKDVKIKLTTNTDIAVKAIEDTIRNYDFEIDELTFKRDNLDVKAAQNIFMNIPKLNEEIELKTRLKENAVALLEKAMENGKTE